MIRRTRLENVLRALLVMGIGLSAGCASLQPPGSTVSDVTPQREQRKQQIVQTFVHRRNQAQYRAALSRWQNGDAAGCEKQLTQILTEEPDHKEARQLLADLYVERDDTDSAMSELQLLIQHHPDDAQAHHSLGLLLDSLDRSTEALPHLRRAADLDPTNELYQKCLVLVDHKDLTQGR